MRKLDWVIGLCLHGILLAVLLWGVLVTLAGAVPRERSAEEFWARLKAGDVTYVAEKRDYSTPETRVDLRWSTGPLTWYHSTDLYSRGQKDLRESGWTEVVHRSPYEGTGRWLLSVWPLRVPDPGTGPVVQIAWCFALLIMLVTKRTRLANRWAWLWLFTIGQIGALLYLLLEPRPLWWGPEEREPMDPPIGGFVGFFLAVVISMVIGLI
ncbi:hypothetical protein GCM10023194_35660 [Planotetraspora phitsanulokensis]|uniref:Uncharacterized protein n=2 Tax=Planotetraspora phitsanulokensis TaxID=575192 RepID=A0A8J3XD89_9ACTN|nr:hypothetical protein Pph01_13090 [Planotetraspora phitsanulokensis]